MRTAAENKVAAAGFRKQGDQCPMCDQKDTACGPTRGGYWCQAGGLVDDPGRLIHTAPDPVAEKVKTDPLVLATALEVEVAQADHDKRREAWELAVKDMATANIMGRNLFILNPTSGVTRPTRRKVKDVDHERIEFEARADMDAAHVVLVRARSRHRAALHAARSRHSQPVGVR